MIALLACAGGPGDTDKHEDTSTSVIDDSGDDSATPPTLEGFEVCGDGLDNDGDGNTDEADCAESWLQGDGEGWRLGSDMVAARGDPSGVLVVRVTEDQSQVCRLAETDGSLDLPWCTQGYDAAAAVVGEETWLSIVRNHSDAGEPDRILLATSDGDEPVERTTLTCSSCPYLGYPQTDLDPTGALLVPGGGGDVYLLPDVSAAGTAIEESATLHLVGDPGSGFGDAVLFLPDPGGDGIPEIVVGMSGSYGSYERSGIFLFDGTNTGTVTSAEATAWVVDDDIEGYAYVVRRAGDVNGDGYSDLTIGFGGSMLIWYGPIEGYDPDPRGRFVAGADRVTGDLSFWGDEATELAFGDEDYGIRVFGGPRDAATLGEDDAELAFDTPYLDALLFGDPDGDGTIELIAADSGYGEADAEGHLPGLVAVYDLASL